MKFGALERLTQLTLKAQLLRITGISKSCARKYMVNMVHNCASTGCVSICLQLRGNEYQWRDLEDADAQEPL